MKKITKTFIVALCAIIVCAAFTACDTQRGSDQGRTAQEITIDNLSDLLDQGFTAETSVPGAAVWADALIKYDGTNLIVSYDGNLSHGWIVLDGTYYEVEQNYDVSAEKEFVFQKSKMTESEARATIEQGFNEFWMPLLQPQYWEKQGDVYRVTESGVRAFAASVGEGESLVTMILETRPELELKDGKAYYRRYTAGRTMEVIFSDIGQTKFEIPQEFIDAELIGAPDGETENDGRLTIDNFAELLEQGYTSENTVFVSSTAELDFNEVVKFDGRNLVRRSNGTLIDGLFCVDGRYYLFAMSLSSDAPYVKWEVTQEVYFEYLDNFVKQTTIMMLPQFWEERDGVYRLKESELETLAELAGEVLGVLPSDVLEGLKRSAAELEFSGDKVTSRNHVDVISSVSVYTDVGRTVVEIPDEFYQASVAQGDPPPLNPVI